MDGYYLHRTWTVSLFSHLSLVSEKDPDARKRLHLGSSQQGAEVERVRNSTTCTGLVHVHKHYTFSYFVESKCKPRKNFACNLQHVLARHVWVRLRQLDCWWHFCRDPGQFLVWIKYAYLWSLEIQSVWIGSMKQCISSTAASAMKHHSRPENQEIKHSPHFSLRSSCFLIVKKNSFHQ